MPKRNSISIDELRAALDYDPLTGLFRHKYRPDMRPQWNARYAGKPAGSLFKQPNRSTDYIRISINGRQYMAQVLAWAHYYGVWPEDDVDHRDKDGLNNRIANLREATAQQNSANSGARSNSRTGLKGVVWEPSRSKFGAYIKVNRKTRFLGRFDSADDAHAAYTKAAQEHFGSFANGGADG